MHLDYELGWGAFSGMPLKLDAFRQELSFIVEIQGLGLQGLIVMYAASIA